MGPGPSIEGMWLEEPGEPVVDVAQLRARDVDAWEVLFDRMYPRMLAYAERRVDSADDTLRRRLGILRPNGAESPSA